MTPIRKTAATIIGAGAVGSALALALEKNNYIVSAVFSKNAASAKRLALRVHASRFGSLSEQKEIASDGVTFITVPDDEIDNVVRMLSRRSRGLSGSVIFHTSGALSSNILVRLKKRGAATGSFHPLQTLIAAAASPENLRNIWIGLEGDAKAIVVGKRIAHAFGSKSFTLTQDQKVLYHIAAVFSSNYFVTLLSIVETLGKYIHMPPGKVISIFEPLIIQSLSNVKERSAAGTLTGPIARGDTRTIAKHRKMLQGKKLNHILTLYSALAAETSRLASRKKNNAR